MPFWELLGAETPVPLQWRIELRHDLIGNGGKIGRVTVVVSLGFLGKIGCGEGTWSGRVDLRVIVWSCIQILRSNVMRVFAPLQLQTEKQQRRKIHTYIYTREGR